MTREDAAPFDFAALDDIAFAAERGRLSGRTPGRMVARDLGPLVELAQLAMTGLLPAPEQAEWLGLDGLGTLYRALVSGRPQWICPDGRRIGFLRTSLRSATDLTIWTGFGVAAQCAAIAAGFPRLVAAQLAAAVGELRSNIYEHSCAPESGLIAFRASLNRFEFVVADLGIGVLESLRSCAEYTGLQDHGDALRLTLTDGVSRHGSNTDHGHGFRPIFIGLANLDGALRFRSGDHALIIDGQNPALMMAKQAEKPMIKGFVVSVVCRRAMTHHS